MTFLGRIDHCRHCNHPRRAHRTELAPHSDRVCTHTGACSCVGFAPSHLSWDVFQAPLGWSVQSRETGREWSGLPSTAAADQLARTLTDLDDMFERINQGGVTCAL
ncbi:hypothetical protein [Mycolicibacterium canariasense]|uniref:hypothetical protein n=1 Tax=Mycolicibacterium canariasense TaxID=228230 RepID=UPI000A1537F2|nr:hypothetical protein [Mycolicibacterium canariasense]MCV7208357.1 hypothetical protein [Mycolicibacterium canariasense]ORV13545.1 hypothetical protein AWB94_04805 [Mycolicibacterium canariasense]